MSAGGKGKQISQWVWANSVDVWLAINDMRHAVALVADKLELTPPRH